MTKPIPLDEMLRKTDEVRGQFAKLVNAAPDEIGFLFATSEGENILAAALDLKAGDNVVVDELHYNTSFVLYRELEKTERIELRIVKHRGGRVTRDDFEKSVNDRTRLVSVAWISHQNGFRHDMRPLADLAHAHGALFYTDAVQALGMFPTDVKAAGVDCLTSGTYKWLLGGFGVAPFYIRRELVDRVRARSLRRAPRREGTRRSSLRDLQDGEEVRVRDAAVRRGLPARRGAHVSRQGRRGPGRAAHRHAGAGALGRAERSRLQDADAVGKQSSIVSIQLTSQSAGSRARGAWTRPARQVSFREKGTQIRISPALFNNRDDIRRFVEIAKTFA